MSKAHSLGGTLVTAIISVALFWACSGSNNLWDCDKGFSRIKCDKPTPEQLARRHLNNGEFSEAIDILTTAISEEPENYLRYPLLAAAYAGRGGIDILGIARKQMSTGESPLQTFSAFLPTPSSVDTTTYQTNLSDVALAVATLNGIPPDILSDTEAFEYSASALLQLTIYQSSYSIMYLNQFIISPATGTISVDQLSNMTDDEAAQVLANLIAVGQLPGASGNSQMQTAVASIVENINGQSGDSTKDKIKAYVATQQSGT
ncbi:MAG: hypothetical protein FJ146_09810 [Deltaproteobacteria bacterium]|nr:hypothetical protein [Deltaproteobacteria bacterium]